MTTNFYTFYATMNGTTILELSQTRKEANDGKAYWTECGGLKVTIKKITFEAVCLNGKIYLPLKYMPQYPMWHKVKTHGIEYAYNIN